MREKILKEVKEERERQDGIWGEQNHKPIEWMAILMEEVGEASKEALEAYFEGKAKDRKFLLKRYRKEIIQVAAVAISMIESFDRNEGKTI
jgi:NTP pyrophosphatase (non-canonical NTP hydrolase)